MYTVAFQLQSSLTDNLLSVFLSSGCSFYVNDDGRHRGRLCPGVRIWIGGHVSIPVKSRFEVIYGSTISQFSYTQKLIADCFSLPFDISGYADR